MYLSGIVTGLRRLKRKFMITAFSVVLGHSTIAGDIPAAVAAGSVQWSSAASKFLDHARAVASANAGIRSKSSGAGATSIDLRQPIKGSDDESDD